MTQLFVRANDNPILAPIKSHAWESEAVFNPGAIMLEGKIYIIYRAAGQEWLTSFGCAISSDGKSIDERLAYPIFMCNSRARLRANEMMRRPYFPNWSGGSLGGCEDPRLVQIEEHLYMTFTFYDGWNPPRLAITSISVRDFLARRYNWKTPSFISPAGQIHKNWVLFPEKINNKFALLHAISPKVLIDYLEDFDFTNKPYVDSKYSNHLNDHRWDSSVRGAGPPPIKIPNGWLLFYHAMDKENPDKYKLGAMILDAKDPSKIIYRAKRPLLEPIMDYENYGFKSGVVYCCGTVIKEEKLIIYYGAADSVTCMAQAPLADVLKKIEAFDDSVC